MSDQPMNVNENIRRLLKVTRMLKQDLENHKRDIKFIEEELLRVQGCMIVFKGFRDVGITVIDPKNKKVSIRPLDESGEPLNLSERENADNELDTDDEMIEHDHDNPAHCGDNPLNDLYTKYTVM